MEKNIKLAIYCSISIVFFYWLYFLNYQDSGLVTQAKFSQLKRCFYPPKFVSLTYFKTQRLKVHLFILCFHSLSQAWTEWKKTKCNRNDQKKKSLWLILQNIMWFGKFYDIRSLDLWFGLLIWLHQPSLLGTVISENSCLSSGTL